VIPIYFNGVLQFLGLFFKYLIYTIIYFSQVMVSDGLIVVLDV